MPVNTEYLSDQTTDFTSQVSFREPVVLHSTLETDSDISGAAIIGSTASINGAVNLGSTVSIRGATTLFAALNSASAISGGALTGTTGDFNSTLTVTDFARFGALSIKTVGAALTTSTVSQDELIMFVLQSSGASLGIRSGSTIWIFEPTDSVAG